MTDEEIETEKYHFWFYQVETVVVTSVITVKRQKFSDEDVNELKQFFRDMGKWETFINAGKSVLEDLGINTKSEEEQKKEFGFEKYKVKYDIKEDRVKVTINLESNESLRRTGGQTQWTALPVEEIREQLKNVPKWQRLTKAISELKTQTFNPS